MSTHRSGDWEGAVWASPASNGLMALSVAMTTHTDGRPGTVPSLGDAAGCRGVQCSLSSWTNNAGRPAAAARSAGLVWRRDRGGGGTSDHWPVTGVLASQHRGSWQGGGGGWPMQMPSPKQSEADYLRTYPVWSAARPLPYRGTAALTNWPEPSRKGSCKSSLRLLDAAQ